ncbi:MAG TPA: ABC transporter permease [Gemmatimonadaceae bacterium]|nr:ABC transporter permease [Gemmatimonadaceae bacterium]
MLRTLAPSIGRRALHSLLVIFIVATIAFGLIAIAPGDPCATDDPRNTLAVQAQCRIRLGLDGPLPDRYIQFLSHAARGDLGQSYITQRPVAEMIGQALPNTILLMSLAIALSLIGGLVLGVARSVQPCSSLGQIAMGTAVVLYSLPEFWLAQIAVFVFAYVIPVFPAGGTVTTITHDYMNVWGRLWDRIDHLILPVLTLAAVSVAGIARFQRNAMRDVAGEDYLRTARAKGVPERDVIMRHALRNALLPLITNIGFTLPALFGGALFVEQVFSWPGMGRLAFDAISQRDAPVVIGCTLVGSGAVVLGSLIADALYAAADPRMRT